MKGALIIFLAAVFLLLILAYLAYDGETGRHLGSKAYHMLLLGWMRMDLALAYGVRYVTLGMERLFKSYRCSGADEVIDRKRQRMTEYRKAYEAFVVGRRTYNRKILH